MQEHKRVKHGQMPGDVCKETKIKMRDGGKGNFYMGSWSSLREKCAKAFRGGIKNKGRTVQRRRDQQTIDDALEDYPQT